MAFRTAQRRRLLFRAAFRGSIARLAHAPSYASPRESPRVAQRLGFPGADSSRGRTSLIRRCLLVSVTCFLLPVLTGATAHAAAFASPVPQTSRPETRPRTLPHSRARCRALALRTAERRPAPLMLVRGRERGCGQRPEARGGRWAIQGSTPKKIPGMMSAVRGRGCWREFIWERHRASRTGTFQSPTVHAWAFHLVGMTPEGLRKRLPSRRPPPALRGAGVRAVKLEWGLPTLRCRLPGERRLSHGARGQPGGTLNP